MSYQYSAPESLEADWRAGRRTPPEELRGALSAHVEALMGRVGPGGDGGLVPVEGRVSDYKSWLAAALADRAQDEGMDVTVLAPQRTNRESATDKMGLFGADLVEHPSRLDLCIWEEWREEVGHVNRSICEEIGCPYYEHNEPALAARSADSLATAERAADARGGGLQLDRETLREMGEAESTCPAEMYLKTRNMERPSAAANTATYAKVFEDTSAHDSGALDADLLILDEAHTVADDHSVATDTIDPEMLTDDAAELVGVVARRDEDWTSAAEPDVTALADALGSWLTGDGVPSPGADPNDLFSGGGPQPGECLEAVGRVAGWLLQDLADAFRDGSDPGLVADLSRSLAACRRVRLFLSRVVSWREGDCDFLHYRYSAGGDTTDELLFREVVGGTGDVTLADVYEEWCAAGTHPVIEARWGPLLDTHIESVWEGRSVAPGGGRSSAGAPLSPTEHLAAITGADSVLTVSATHNDLSDPTRDPGSLRPTRHDLLAAPVVLRTGAKNRDRYSGTDTAAPTTGWFRRLVSVAKQRSGANISAVPINFRNQSDWEQLPVETLEVGGREVPGLVPHSRGSIGEKGLESLDIDCVLCGTQVQPPAETARLLLGWWGLLAPRAESPAEVLDTSWRLLAQHAVSGTIQAAGRFDWDAVNLVFERPGLFELAGFEIEPATTDHGGFAGEFCAAYNEEAAEWADARDSLRATRTVGHLAGADDKAPSPTQVVSEYERIYDCGREEAERAVGLAADRGRIGAETTDDGLRYDVIRDTD